MNHAPAGLTAAVALASLVCGAGLAEALEVQVTTVRATSHGPSDVRLTSVRPRLRRLVGYRSFRVVQEQRRECAWKSHEPFQLPGGLALYVVPKALRDEAVSLHVRLLDGSRELIDTDVQLQNRGVMLFGVEQERQAEDGALIIMLKAEAN